jgi:Holliday junction resolvase
MTPEGRVKTAIKAFLKSLHDCWYFMPATHGYGSSGVPDIVGCYKGVFFAIEVKAPGKRNTVTALQMMQINGISEAMGWAIVSDDVDRVREMFAMIDLTLNVAAA